ncbi:Long-chain fatty acid transporter [Rasamsonia emersonii CBS 393.64]|uniref:Very long-chain fatty acid transport protein n=1 Tax=Rasamsonia emersonii (strain ATCC 16479 / CBS 393.64 / IMI 116815) TaxID=1408163 RepID=A0A0F4YET5_RASE3|nr:Long-chain fatty acid transporter [Rasamsonia emersonii CBS 393.64]KKA16727.1 Long-chain fatty acid transporter [Rasamsonia emersonii CBS 393.64]
MDPCLDIPLRIAAPAVAASLAYLNARWSVFYDWNLLSALVRILLKSRLAEHWDRINLFYVLEKHALASSTANHPFIVYNGRTWTFHETYQTALRYGQFFKNKFGVKPKEIVAMDFMNSSNFVFIWMGLWSIGAVPAFINYNLSGKPLTHSVKVSSARLLIVDEEVRDRFPPEQLATFSSPDFRDDKGPVEVVFFTPDLEAQILQTAPIREDDSARSGPIGRDMAMLIYTSGTTGLPKPAIVSWFKCWAGGTFITKWISLKKTDRVFTCMPLYHSTAAILAFCACLIGGTTLIIGHRFSARNFWKEVRENDATIIQYVGETLRYLLAVPREVDPVTGEDLDKKNNVRVAYGNGLRPDVWNRVKERFGIETIAEFYASTEGVSGHWNISSNDFAAGAIGRNGYLAQLLLGRTMAIVEVDHETEAPWRDPKTGFCRRVPRGEPGELIYALDPDNISQGFQGYYNNSKATEGKILRDVFAKGDAWFRTGDMVRWDHEGRWYFSDRIGDTFRWKSENVSTSEVAEILGNHPAILEANVYGVSLPHHDGRAGCAAIVLRDQNVASEGQPAPEPSAAVLESLAAHALANLPRYAVPLFLRVTPQMQATGNNKQQKHTLRVEGVDPSRVAATDRLYWLQNNNYHYQSKRKNIPTRQ